MSECSRCEGYSAYFVSGLQEPGLAQDASFTKIHKQQNAPVYSWIEHLRQHARVSNTDRELQQRVRSFDLEGDPEVTHFVAAS